MTHTTTTQTRARYYTYSPRGFCNEYIIIATHSAAERAQLWEWYRNTGSIDDRLTPVTVANLRRLDAVERWARKTDYIFSGYCPLSTDYDGKTDAADFLAAHGEGVTV